MLHALSQHSSAGADASALQEQTGLSTRTLYRHLTALKELGMVSEASARGSYRLGPALEALAEGASDRRQFLRQARAFCEEAASRSGESVHVTTLDQGTVVTLAAAAGGDDDSTEARPVVVPGSRRALHASASGKLFLAYSPTTYKAYTVRPLETFTQFTVTQPAELRRECLHIRDAGYALDRQEYKLGLTCVSVPVFGVDGRIIGAFTISKLTPAFSHQQRDDLLRVLRPAADALSTAIGGTPPHRSFFNEIA